VFSHEDIEYGSVLGKGGEGIVQRCKVIYNELPVEAAVKTVLNNSDDALNITLDEIELLWYVMQPADWILNSCFLADRTATQYHRYHIMSSVSDFMSICL